MIWCAEVYGWTPTQVRDLSLRDLQLLSDSKKYAPRRR